MLKAYLPKKQTLIPDSIVLGTRLSAYCIVNRSLQQEGAVYECTVNMSMLYFKILVHKD